ncbi:MAG: signal recognition particle-docking protein FtsY [Desulfurella sp.]|uniref:Signal recognition particle receptor FtsY n=1 Tax=Desulfurella multipotens TaxID=79269 RepID=A0A1G6K076_9BACT|nr:signal recognition particle-docking protein FtsY [Desulfurella multipotens]PMP67587.1 MAG: signal recognition particle-docking protein FtsY [Desulfurella multipotens]SDC24390.1 fused signal recognition particle receptor [Desulfurella multipotens]
MSIFDIFKKIKSGFTQEKETLKDKPIDQNYLDQLEELLITSDFGVEITQKIIEEINKNIGGSVKTIRDAEFVIRNILLSVLESVEKPLYLKGSPFVIMVVGINGSGKTTTIGKLASLYSERGKNVLLVAADTFRAAAIEQLQEWAKKSSCDILALQTKADPAAVAYDGVHKAIAKNYDVVLIDTAGRLHTQKHLMEEVKKIKRSIAKLGNYPQEILLVLDSTIGQNALVQAKEFNNALGVSGIVLTKLDSTSKGGIIFAISQELKIPIRYIGMGEKIEDLRAFVARDFIESLLDPIA